MSIEFASNAGKGTLLAYGNTDNEQNAIKYTKIALMKAAAADVVYSDVVIDQRPTPPGSTTGE